jgi:hypothetical protein
MPLARSGAAANSQAGRNAARLAKCCSPPSTSVERLASAFRAGASSGAGCWNGPTRPVPTTRSPSQLGVSATGLPVSRGRTRSFDRRRPVYEHYDVIGGPLLRRGPALSRRKIEGVVIPRCRRALPRHPPRHGSRGTREPRQGRAARAPRGSPRRRARPSRTAVEVVEPGMWQGSPRVTLRPVSRPPNQRTSLGRSPAIAGLLR